MMSSCVDWARAGGMLACLVAAAACGRPASQAPRASAAPPRQISFDDLEFDIQRDGHFDRRLLTPAIVDLDGRPKPSYYAYQDGTRRLREA